MPVNYKLFSNVLFCILGLGISQHGAAFCYDATLGWGSLTSVDVNMAVGRVVVKPSDAVGTILRKATFPIVPNNSRVRCTSYSDKIYADIKQGYSLSVLGQNIYNTNIPGIGIRLYREAEDSANFSGYYPYQKNLDPLIPYSLGQGYFVVEIIKTLNNSGSGSLVPGLYSSYYVSGLENKPLLTSTVYGNAITIASSSCEIQGNINKTITLPSVKKSDFKGVGSTQGEQTFDVDILCNGGSNNTGVNVESRIGLSFDYPAETNTTNVLANTATTSKANGVGVQLLMSDQNKVISKGEKINVGNVNSNQIRQYNLPMKARYYQTNSEVSAGNVKAMATITITYD
ncbi:fimbrial protein [Acinetobacter sp. UBA3106]|uniref:fimbrial protein n=1 Tax=Acinetobacter sp. UBA3106 TaxID=1945936 RepID=UPI0025C237D3|nr:fimbrial protein [Acinetobacter sp. UBA3106]